MLALLRRITSGLMELFTSSPSYVLTFMAEHFPMSPRYFLAAKAALYVAMSVCWSVGRLVGRQRILTLAKMLEKVLET
jgi:hypothetical protein